MTDSNGQGNHTIKLPEMAYKKPSSKTVEAMTNELFDVLIVGSGPSGANWAYELSKAGLRCLMLEAGDAFFPGSYPRKEISGTLNLYWSGGIEFNKQATIGMLRARCVGGGSVLNGGLFDRFDDLAFDGFRKSSGISWMQSPHFTSYYDLVEQDLTLRKIPEEFRNENGRLFADGLKAKGFNYSPLVRGQTDCQFPLKNDAIECLNGCQIACKQSVDHTLVQRAAGLGLQVLSQFYVQIFRQQGDGVVISGKDRLTGKESTFRGRFGVLATGPMGNTSILHRSGLATPAVGERFYCHPQTMVLAEMTKPINGHKGPLQSYKSDDLRFREQGFKLENVIAGPAAMGALLPLYGKEHHDMMTRATYLGCLEVAIRDSNPGRLIYKKSTDRLVIDKSLNHEDQEKNKKGLAMISDIFHDQGAKRVFKAPFSIGLHLMGGCTMGNDPKNSVVKEDFSLHKNDRIFCSDGSVFPEAPGINPAFSIMAFSKLAVTRFLAEKWHS